MDGRQARVIGALHQIGPEAWVAALQQQLNARLEDIPAFVQSLQEKQKQLEKELKQLRMKLASGGSSREGRSTTPRTTGPNERGYGVSPFAAGRSSRSWKSKLKSTSSDAGAILI